jgi:hypothetical protein
MEKELSYDKVYKIALKIACEGLEDSDKGFPCIKKEELIARLSVEEELPRLGKSGWESVLNNLERDKKISYFRNPLEEDYY